MKTLETLFKAVPMVLGTILAEENKDRLDDFVENFEDLLLLINKSADLAVEAAMEVYVIVENLPRKQARSIKNEDEQRIFEKMKELFAERV